MKWIVRILGSLVVLVVLCVIVLLVLGSRPGANTIVSSVEIARPPEVVWPWLTEPARMKQWVAWLVEVRQEVPGADSVGSRETWVMDDPNMKMRIEMNAVVTKTVRYREMGAHITMPKMFEGDASYTLTPTATGTLLRSRSTWTYDEAFSRLMAPIVNQQGREKERKDFAKLKSLVEAS